jgi:signal transduction histidine kinase
MAMGLALVLGLLLLLFFFFFSSRMISHILTEDMDQMASLLGNDLNREMHSRVEQANQIAQDNALHVLLRLDLPAQARRFLSQRLQDGPFSGFWLLRPDGSLLAAARKEDADEPAPMGLTGPDRRLLVLTGRLHLALRGPVHSADGVRGHLVAVVEYPSQALLRGISVERTIGLAFWDEERIVAASPWLADSGLMSELRLQHEEITVDQGSYLVRTFSQGILPRTELPMQAQLLRNKHEAEGRLRQLLSVFIASWFLMLFIFLAFGRYLNKKLVNPVLDLANMAQHVGRHKSLPDRFCHFDPSAPRDEINDLYRAFYEMVNNLNKARLDAEAADKAKSNFLSMVSHELRTPLTSVLGFAKIIRRKLNAKVAPDIDSRAQKAGKALEQINVNLDIIVAEGERLTDLINDVLDLAKLESGRMEWKMDVLDPQALINQSVAATSPLFQQKGLPCVVELQPGLPHILGDKDRLMQVLVNLLSNAVKFTDHGHVLCSATVREGWLVTSVADTGIGIPEHEQTLIFERFQQVGETLTDKPKGTGLGLSICKQIIEHHKGHIWCESEPGKGSRFHFSLPLSSP